MRLVINGERREVERGDTVSRLLGELGIDPRRVAVIVNDTVVATDCRDTTPLQADDRVEVLTFAAGG